MGIPSTETTLPALSMVGVSIHEPKPECPERRCCSGTRAPDGSLTPVSSRCMGRARKEKERRARGPCSGEHGRRSNRHWPHLHKYHFRYPLRKRMRRLPLSCPSTQRRTHKSCLSTTSCLKRRFRAMRGDSAAKYPGGSFHSVCERRGTHVVSWVVDDEDLMWSMLEAGVVESSPTVLWPSQAPQGALCQGMLMFYCSGGHPGLILTPRRYVK